MSQTQCPFFFCFFTKKYEASKIISNLGGLCSLVDQAKHKHPKTLKWIQHGMVLNRIS